tara:strand:- start:182 stop:616 length:435 start_codon:yes stop_codon:yes gene_type:complete
MALLGGGGGGGPLGVGNSFTGPATGLEIVGDHAYAYSGLITAQNTDQTALSFTSGNYYLVGYLQLNAPVDDDNPASVSLTACRVSFNGTGVFIIVSGDGVHRSSRSVRQKIIIPAYTEVVAIIDSEATAADQYGSVVITGRIYR